MTQSLTPLVHFRASDLSRRQFAGLLSGSGALLLAGCGGGSSSDAGIGGGGVVAIPLPVITTQPIPQTVAVGAQATFNVAASGSNLTYQWRRDGVALSGATGANLTVTVATADAGAQYSVVVSNTAGQVTSQSAVLTVKAIAGLGLLAGGLSYDAPQSAGNGLLARFTNPLNVAFNKGSVVFFHANSPLMPGWISGYVGTVSAQRDVSFLDSSVESMELACDSKGVIYRCIASVNRIYTVVNTPGEASQFSVFAGDSLSQFVRGSVDEGGFPVQLKAPRSPVFDSQDNLYFIDFGNHAIRKVAPNRIVTTIAGSPTTVTMVDGKGSAAGFASPTKLLVLKDGSLLVLDSNRWRKVLPDGTVSTLPATLPEVRDVVGTDTGAMYALLGNSVVKLALDGSTTPVAGSQTEVGYAEGAGDAVRFHRPSSLALTPAGELFVADTFNDMIRRVDPVSGRVSAWAGATRRLDGEGTQARFTSMGPSCLDREGNLYVIDIEAKTLRKVTPTGFTSTAFTNFPSDGGVAVDATGSFYGVRDRAIIKVSPAGNQVVWAGQPGVLGFADGQGAVASFARPIGLVVDADGNLFVGDSPDESRMPLSHFITCTYGTTIRKITHKGMVSTVAGVPGRTFTFRPQDPTNPIPTPDITFLYVLGMASDGRGTIWVLTPEGVRRIDGQGGEPVWLWKFASTGIESYLSAIAYASGSQGDVYVASSSTILKVRADGSQTVIAGTGISRWEGGRVQLGALPASLGTPTSLVAVSTDLLYCCSENSVLKVQLV